MEFKIKEQNILCMSLSFDNDNNQYEDFKLYEDIKEEQAYFKIVFKEITELISKDKVELNKIEEHINYSIILPLKKRKSLDFILHVQTKN